VGEPEETVVEVQHRVSHPALGDVVVRCKGFDQRSAGPVRFVELPGTFVPLILDLGDGWHIADPRRPDRAPERHGSFVAGLTDGPVEVAHGGWACCLQIDLTPMGARRVLGVPMHELANRTVDVEDVLGRAGRALVERLADAPDWPERFALVESALGAWAAEARPASPEVAWAMRRLTAEGAGGGVGVIARELGWSHRRLIARFRDEVGLPPKLVERVARFERLVGLLHDDPATALGRAAAACGYFDQAHLARDVRDLAGMTPTALRA
jgi:AraC-like DNA-binding protein